MEVKLHLGCGSRYIPGFIHIDLANHPSIDYNHNISTLPMFDDRNVDLIYACHVLEYFDRVEVMDVLAEWRRVLKPGGILRVAVPNFEALLAVYYHAIRGDRKGRKRRALDMIHGPLYGRWEPHGTGEVIYHRTVYNYASLHSILHRAGFEDIHHYDWRDTIHKDYDDYSQAYIPHMDKENGTLISLNVEARRRKDEDTAV